MQKHVTFSNTKIYFRSFSCGGLVDRDSRMLKDQFVHLRLLILGRLGLSSASSPPAFSKDFTCLDNFFHYIHQYRRFWYFIHQDQKHFCYSHSIFCLLSYERFIQDSCSLFLCYSIHLNSFISIQAFLHTYSITYNGLLHSCFLLISMLFARIART